MNSRDLYREVQVLYNKKSVFGEKIAFSDYSEMLYDYTSRKLLEAGHQEDLVYDLGFLFDRLNGCFQSKKEKESFYQNYVHCLLNYYNDISGQVTLWEMETEPVKEASYPRFENHQCITFFQTLKEQSHEDAALWLWDVLKRVSKKQEAGEKGTVYQKECSLWNQ